MGGGAGEASGGGHPVTPWGVTKRTQNAQKYKLQSLYSSAPRWATNETEIIMGHSIRRICGVLHLLEKIQKAKDTKSKTPIKTWSRRSMITPDFVGLTFNVHNGKVFNPVFVTENMVGHRLGEFSLTRTFKKHGAHTAKAEAK